MSIRLLRASDLGPACSMLEAIQAVAAGFIALSSGQAAAPTRLTIPLGHDGVALTMPASLAGSSCYSVKVVSVVPANLSAGRPLVSATVLLMDPASGRLLALIDGTALTALRTGAAGGLAARTLARPDAQRVALFGAGVQARSQVIGVAAVRAIKEIRLVTRDPRHTAAFQEWATSVPSLSGIGIVAATATEAVDGADIVVTATSSPTPVFPGAALAPGAHVTAIGSFTPAMRELDDATLHGARVVVDERFAALAEAGELQHLRPAEVVEIGEILSGTAAGRTGETERTIFKSVGNAIQDLAVATRAYERAHREGIGEMIAFP